MTEITFNPLPVHINKLKEYTATHTDEELCKIMKTVYIQCQKSEDDICDALIENKFSVVETLKYFYKDKLVTIIPRTSNSINQFRMTQIRKIMTERQRGLGPVN